eukprot:2420287-Prymnesium_polylepis.1
MRAPQPAPPAGGAPPGAVPTLSAGLSFLPTFFGLPFTLEPGTATELSPEQERQAFLSRLLLLLGSTVILCLLLF